jgi:hypothetical protein
MKLVIAYLAGIVIISSAMLSWHHRSEFSAHSSVSSNLQP